MKYAIYLGALILIVFGVYYYFNKDSKNDTYVSTKTSKSIILYKEKGQVFIKNKGEQDIIPVGANSIEINNLTEVTTASSSRASVLLPDNSMISLSENTVITINYNEYGTSVFQSLGQTYHRVQKLVTGKSYEVQTPSTLAAVRGTKFAILYDGATKKTKVAVTEKLVAVSRIKKVEGSSTSTLESPILVGEGNTANVNEYKTGESKKDAQVEIIPNKEEKDVSSWIEENRPTDFKFNEFKDDLDKGNVEIFREKLDQVIREKEKTKEEDTPKINEEEKDVELKTEIVEDIKKETEDVKTTIEENVPPQVTPKEEVKKIETTNTVTNTVYKKYYNEEAFITAFDDLLIKYFYIDDDEDVCEVLLSPENKVKEIVGLGQANGKTFPSDGLLKLAVKIKDYCSIGSNARDRAILQSEFEAVMPSF